jgi:FtsP/CotA-like multicopper oxidase with cupredoxin domain
MASWSITITKPDSTTVFSPDPLAPVQVNDDVSWANETDDVHQIAIQGVTFTEPIQPFTPSTPAYLCQGNSGDVIPYNCVIPGHKEKGTIKIGVLLLCALLLGIVTPSARAQSSPAPIDCAPLIGKELKDPPEITKTGTFTKGTLVTAAANERMAFAVAKKSGPLLAADGKPDPTKIQCFQQWVRTYSKDAPLGSQAANAPVIDPLAGPTIRTRVGDLVELTFLNLIEPLRFPRADLGKCDETAKVVNGQVQQVYPGTDTYPDCFNESIVTNVHFHGTHTNPTSTGDNVFLLIKPSPRSESAERTPAVNAESVRVPFSAFFQRCEAELSTATNNTPKQWPRLWGQAPKAFRDWADDTVKSNSPALYAQNQNAIANGAWPQNYVGAVPYCFRLPTYTATTWPPPQPAVTTPHTHGAGSAEMDETQAPARPLVMGQAPGTHWYHAHKHGSTTINVSNGMTGVIIIEGASYDDAIKSKYPNGIKQHVLVVQQLGGLPHLERGAPGPDPYFSINGQLQPVIEMNAGEVQWWRIANTSSRGGVYFCPPTTSQCSATTLANSLTWKQIAQDGVQFNPTNYGAAWNNSAPFLLASGNRADLLVKAPDAAGTYPVVVYDTIDPRDRTAARNPVPLDLLYVKVSSTKANMTFYDTAPDMPLFLKDIAASEVRATRTLTFSTNASTDPATPPGTPGGPGLHQIDGKKFDGEVGAAVVLNQVEEWTVVNETYGRSATPTAPARPGIAHPFHIHINPFQIVEQFSPDATVNNDGVTPVYLMQAPGQPAPTPGPNQCVIDPLDPATWHPCANVPKPATIWWDVFPIPSGVRAVDAGGNPIIDPKTGLQALVPGHFKSRSRYVDYAGYYVLHCHILAHEDRGMMTVVYVTPLQPPFSHH